MRINDLEEGLRLISSGQCQEGFILDLRYKYPGSVQITCLVEALTSGDCPKGFTLNLANNNLESACATPLADTLKSGKCPKGFTLNLRFNNLGPAGATAFADALKSQMCPGDFTLDLWYNNLGSDAATAFADALKSQMCPGGFTLKLRFNNLGPDAATAFADALKSGGAPKGLLLILGGNDLGPNGVTALANALKSGMCPEGFTLDLSFIKLELADTAALADALKSRKCPKGFTLKLEDNELEPTSAVALAEALILTPGVNILGPDYDDFPLVKRASQLAQQIALLWQAGDDESNDAAYSQIVETIQETPELLVILISRLIETNALNDDTERHAYAILINALINQLELTANLKDLITHIAANSEFEDVVKNAAEMTSTRGQLPALLTDLKASFETNEIEKQIREVLSGDFGLLTFLRDDIATLNEFSITLDDHISSITQANLRIEVIGFLGSLAALIASSDQAALQPYIPVLHRLQFKVSTPDSLEKNTD